MKRNKTTNIVEIERYSPKIDEGLFDEQVQKRKELNLTNDSKIKSSKSYASIFAKNIFTFFNLLWFIIAVALIVVGAYMDLFFLLVIVLNTLIAIVQEIRAKITVEKLSMTISPDVTVIRNSKEEKIKATDLVLDDIFILQNGDQVPTDCIILSETTIEVNESLLTGESVPVKKNKGDLLLCGSFLVSGKCFTRVEKVGKDNYIQTIAAKAKEFKAPSSNLFKSLNRLIKYIGIALIPLAIGTIIKEWFTSYDIVKTVTDTSGAITGMIPAGMFLLITIALSVGVIKLAKKKTLVKDIYSIEMLARTDVLCLDKTGTITDGTMNVVEVINTSKFENEKINEIISNILFAQASTNMTSLALSKHFPIRETLKAKNITEFSSTRKFSVTTFEDGKTYYLGAVSFTNCKITKKQQELINEQMEKGNRVIGLVEANEEYDEKVGATGKTLLALIALEDHIRTDAIETIKWFKENGVEIKIISGDDPLTVSKIAKRVEIENCEKYISLENVSLEEVEAIAEQYTVFGRVSPEQKYTLIKTLKAKGHTVAMTGDGVNDTLALKEANCSIAMADGSEVARNISKLVLMDSKFSSLPSVVKEGRQVINNVQNSSVLFLMKTLFTILLCAITLIIGRSYPFSPKNIFILEMFVIGVPPFMLTFEPNDKKISGNFIPQVLKKSLPRAIILLIGVLVSLFAIKGLTALESTTLPILALIISGFINLIWLCIPFNWYRAIIVLLSAGLIATAVCALPNLFGIASLADMAVFNPVVWITLGAIVAGDIILIGLYELIRFLIMRKLKKKKNMG